MGQYHHLINLDKKEHIHAHSIGNGLKLMEQVGFEKSTASALWLLLAASNGRGGGDAMNHPLVGSWAGDRIVILGDYCESTDLKDRDAKAVYKDLENYTDISTQVKAMLDKEFGGEPAKEWG